jgi:excisionase family DNA binding protein
MDRDDDKTPDDLDDIGLNAHIEPHPPGQKWPDYVWVKFPADGAPAGGLAYCARSPEGERNLERKVRPTAATSATALPLLLTVEEVAGILRTSRGAIYSKVERGLLPGLVRDGSRILFHRDELLRSLTPRTGGRR